MNTFRVTHFLLFALKNIVLDFKKTLKNMFLRDFSLEKTLQENKF